jgi:hypothetical protein
MVHWTLTKKLKFKVTWSTVYLIVKQNYLPYTSHRGLVVSITDYELGGLDSNPSRGIAGFFDRLTPGCAVDPMGRLKNRDSSTSGCDSEGACSQTSEKWEMSTNTTGVHNSRTWLTWSMSLARQSHSKMERHGNI